MFYENFTIGFRATGTGIYQTELLEAPPGVKLVTGSFIPPFNGDKLREDLKKLIRCGDVRPSSAILEPLSEALFSALFNGSMREALDQALEQSNSHLRFGFKILSGDERGEVDEVECLPWELLRSPNQPNPLVLYKKTPIVRFLDIEKTPKTSLKLAPRDKTLKALVFISDRQNCEEGPQIPREEFREALPENGGASYLNAIYLQGDTMESLKAGLEEHRPEILVLVCHGSEPTPNKRSKIAIRGESGQENVLDGATLCSLLKTCDHKLKLVVLLTCNSGCVVDSDPRSFLAGIATSLIKDGVPMVVGMQFEISFQAAIKFLKGFLADLSRQKRVEEALARARCEISCSATVACEALTPVLFSGVDETYLWRLQPEIVIHTTREPDWERIEESDKCASLDLRAFFKPLDEVAGRNLKDEYNWNRDLLPILQRIPKKYKLDSSLPATFSGDPRLSICLAIGWQYRRATNAGGFCFQSSQDSADYWSSKADSCEPPKYREEREKFGDRISDLYISISISRNTPKENMSHHIKNLSLENYARMDLLLEEIGGNAIANGEQALALAKEFARRILSYKATLNATMAHLFMAAPMGFAGLLGTQLNTIGRLQLYEYTNGSYTKSFLLKD